MEITIIEGARGTGKSTLAFKLRQMTPETTLINFTGFHTDGEKGLSKVAEYYNNWMNFFRNMKKHDSKFIFDRFYFSESVYSRLYKNYNFAPTYRGLNKMLEYMSTSGVKINIIFLTVNDENVLKQRLIREKVPFGKAEETVKESLLQQEAYRNLFVNFGINYSNENLNVYTIDTSHISLDEVYDKIVETLQDRSL